MSDVDPTLIDNQGITINNSNLERSVTLTMDGSNQGFILQYDKLTANPKRFSITHNGINFFDPSNNHTTGLQRLSLVQQAFQAVELPPNSKTLQINNTLLLNDASFNVTSKLNLDQSGNLTIDASGDIIFNPVGSVETNGKTLNMGGGEIHRCDLLHSRNNQNIIIEGRGTGDVILKTNNVNRFDLEDDGYWTCQGRLQYDNSANVLYADFSGNGINIGAATQIRPRTRNVNATLYPVFVDGSGNQNFKIDKNTGPLTYNPFLGVMSFPGVPTCTTSATTTNQLANFNNFAVQSWTPTVTGSVVAGTPGYTIRNGRFVRINKVCIGQGEIQLSGATLGGMSGDLRVSLPFNCSNDVPASIQIGLMNGMSVTSINFKLTADTGASFARWLTRPTTTSTNYTALTNLNITTDPTTFRCRFSFAYIIQ
jgi:hypothetical protein